MLKSLKCPNQLAKVLLTKSCKTVSLLTHSVYFSSQCQKSHIQSWLFKCSELWSEVASRFGSHCRRRRLDWRLTKWILQVTSSAVDHHVRSCICVGSCICVRSCICVGSCICVRSCLCQVMYLCQVMRASSLECLFVAVTTGSKLSTSCWNLHSHRCKLQLRC